MIPLSKQGGKTHQQAVGNASSGRIVPKPVPEAQTKDPRGYQIDQLRRRFAPQESTLPDGTTSLAFKMKPSDPDFPFDLDFLECDIQVPEDYPEEAVVLRVRNRNIPRGFCINVERGWEKLVRERRGATILALTHALDKNLEVFLSEQKAETVTLMSFKDDRHESAAGPSTSANSPASTAQISAAPSPAAAHTPRQPLPREPIFTRDQIAEAKARRAQETRQIETRMGRMSLYRRSADGIVYTLPVEPKRRSELPPGLQAVKTLHLIVPLLYPLQPLRIQLNEVESSEAEILEDIFIEKATEQKQMTLTSHLNYLAQNMHVLAKQAAAAAKAHADAEAEIQARINTSTVAASTTAEAAEKTTDDHRSHVKVIARPPEWSTPREHDEESSSSDEYSDDSGDMTDEGGAAVESAPLTLSSGLTAEHGIAMNFPGIELHGIELFQVSILSISVKCERCKTINEVASLRDEKEKTLSCRKCAAGIVARFRPQLVHQNSVRAGFLDVAGATVADMLPSTFVPVCAKCSTPSQGLVSVRGENTTNVCRECHGKFTFKIPDVRFLAYAAGFNALSAPAAGNPRKQEKLGLHAGDPLPNRGTCGHYRKSYRWFRFTCCNRVYPCDQCHDEAEGHINEWANRMVCGWCSREQRYAVGSCGFCGRSVVARKGTGFWEGGKGTRNQALMSRKEKRKYKRPPGSAPKKD